jgi:hypothetical protein
MRFLGKRGIEGKMVIDATNLYGVVPLAGRGRSGWS